MSMIRVCLDWHCMPSAPCSSPPPWCSPKSLVGSWLKPGWLDAPRHPASQVVSGCAAYWHMPVFEILIARSATIALFALGGCAVCRVNPLGNKYVAQPHQALSPGDNWRHPVCKHISLHVINQDAAQEVAAAHTRPVWLWRHWQLFLCCCTSSAE